MPISWSNFAILILRAFWLCKRQRTVLALQSSWFDLFIFECIGCIGHNATIQWYKRCYLRCMAHHGALCGLFVRTVSVYVVCLSRRVSSFHHCLPAGQHTPGSCTQNRTSDLASSLHAVHAVHPPVSNSEVHHLCTSLDLKYSEILKTLLAELWRGTNSKAQSVHAVCVRGLHPWTIHTPLYHLFLRIWTELLLWPEFRSMTVSITWHWNLPCLENKLPDFCRGHCGSVVSFRIVSHCFAWFCGRATQLELSLVSALADIDVINAQFIACPGDKLAPKLAHPCPHSAGIVGFGPHNHMWLLYKAPVYGIEFAAYQGLNTPTQSTTDYLERVKEPHSQVRYSEVGLPSFASQWK